MTRSDPKLADLAADRRAAKALVIGAGLGGLAAAMRLGAKGYRVTLLDRLDSPGGRGSALWRAGHRFDLGPTIVTAPQVFRDLWTACGRDFDAEVDLRPLDPFYEIRWPDGSRFAARPDSDAMRAEIKRLSPGDLPGYEAFLAESRARHDFGFEGLGRRPMHRLWDLIKVLPRFARLRADRSVARHARRRFRDPRLQMAFSFHPLFIGGDPFHVTSMYTLVSHLEKEYGVHCAMGGVAAIADAMVRVIEDQGGAVRMQSEVDEILVQAGRARAVRLTSGEILTADVIVANGDPGQVYGHLLRNHPKRRWTAKRFARARWSMGLFVWYFGTRQTRHLWPDLGQHTILNGPRYQGLVDDIFLKGHLAEDMSLYLHRPTITDPSAAPEGGDTFYALSPVPHLGHANPVNWSKMAEPYRQKVEALLEAEVMPGLSAHLTVSEVFTPETFRSRYLAPHGTGFSLEPRILQSAWFRPHNVSEEVAGLYLAGAGTHPGAGLPGVISSAEALAQCVPDPEPVQ